MRILCSNCRQILSIDGPAPGQLVTCPACQAQTNAPDDHFAPGVVINDFVMEHLLGRGGMGAVFLAHQISLDRQVALKVMLPGESGLTSALDGLMKEGRAAARLVHPNVLQAYAVGAEEGVCFLALEYIDGESVGELLHKEEFLPPETAFPLVAEIAEGLYAGWQQVGMVHLDVKPDNIMVAKNGTAKLADLGLAKLVDELSGSAEDEAFMSTPEYVSPEVVLGLPIDHRSDLYSLGGTLFHMLTGHVPFAGANGVEIAKRHLSDEFVIEPPHRSRVPPSVQATICRLMAKNPLDRVQTGQELSNLLRQALDGSVNVGLSGVDAADPAMQWECPECGRRNALGVKYCVDCGTFGKAPCLACKEEAPLSARFCPHCGADLVQARQAQSAETTTLLAQLHDLLEADDRSGAAAILQRLGNLDNQPVSDHDWESYESSLARFREPFDKTIDACNKKRDLGGILQATEELTAVCGRAACQELLADVEEIQRTLRQCIFEAAAAVNANCFALGQAILETVEPWRGGALGQRRAELHGECRHGLVERAGLLKLLKRHVDCGQHRQALEQAARAAALRLKRELTSAAPLPDDELYDRRAAECLDILDKQLQSRVTDSLQANRWEEVTSIGKLVHAAQGDGACKFTSVDELIAWEIEALFKHASALEAKGRMTAAAAEWERIRITIPKRLMTKAHSDHIAAFSVRREFRRRERLKLVLRRFWAGMAVAWLIGFPISGWLLCRRWEISMLSSPKIVVGILGFVLVPFMLGFGRGPLRRLLLPAEPKPKPAASAAADG